MTDEQLRDLAGVAVRQLRGLGVAIPDALVSAALDVIAAAFRERIAAIDGLKGRAIE